MHFVTFFLDLSHDMIKIEEKETLLILLLVFFWLYRMDSCDFTQKKQRLFSWNKIKFLLNNETLASSHFKLEIK
jgi:hypothetical protein